MFVLLWYKCVIFRIIFLSFDKCEWEVFVVCYLVSEWNFLDFYYIKCISIYVVVYINVKFMMSLMIIYVFNFFMYFFLYLF